MKKNFSTPKIYTANGDLKKRWYVNYHFRNPKTGLLERMGTFMQMPIAIKTKKIDKKLNVRNKKKTVQ